MKYIKFYYGISGTLKRTTIQSELEKKGNSAYSMWSMIKPWKDYERGVFNSKPSDLNYANLHLCRLIDYLYQCPSEGRESLLVERGVTDMLFYWLKKGNSPNPLDTWIREVTREEDFLCDQNSYYMPERVLLIMKDIDFIENVILREPKRKECFPGGVMDYLEQQNEYVEFTKKYNKISSTVTIKDAKYYIENDLGFKYDERKI